MFELYLTERFKSDLDALDKRIREKVWDKTLPQLEESTKQKGTHSETHFRGRKVNRSRVTDNFRLLWEWSDGGAIRLWRVAKHDVIDAVDYLPSEPKSETKYARDKRDQRTVELDSLYVAREGQQPFAYTPKNILRLLGVPDEQLEAVKALEDADAIWDIPLPENVQSTLVDILSNPEWSLDELFDPRQLLYRTTVDQLEGYCEGKLKKLLLNLNEEQEQYVQMNANGPVLIKGVAGSGKTTIGLYRAHLLAERLAGAGRMFREGTSILLLTYTRALTKALEQLYRELYGDELSYELEVASHKDWMLQELQQNGLFLKEAERGKRQALVKESKREVIQESAESGWISNKPPQFFLDEFDQVIRARRVASLPEYQAIERVGRGSALDRQRHRPLVWQVYQRYQKKLDEQNLFDWADLAGLVEKHCPQLPQYDVVIVDEAQDLPPSDLHLLTKLLPDYQGHRSLTLLADPAQSIYYRGIPWKDAGINIQGRTRILAKNYRNSVEILEAARPIVEGCEDLKEAEEFVSPTSAGRRGRKPRVVSYRSAAASNAYLAQEIIRLCRGGQFRPGDIAVLARQNFLLTRYIRKYLEKRDIPCAFHHDDDFHVFQNKVKLITMHSAKGLEYPVVFLVGLADKYFPVINKQASEESLLQERKLFYVSMTRAAECLYLLHPQWPRCRFLYDLSEDSIRRVKA